MAADVWYQCDRCTACCRWPGDVRIEEDEIGPIAAHLGMGEDAFIQKFTRLRMNRNGLSLVEKENDECVMLVDGKCAIQPVKPFQCKGFPNRWNFKGWEKVCHAKAVPMNEAVRMGLVEAGNVSADSERRGRDVGDEK